MIIRITFVLTLLVAACGNVSAEAPTTMRLDYFHTGNHDTEMFSLDEVVIEALPWTGVCNLE